MKEKHWLNVLTDPKKNFLLFFVTGLILLPIVSDGISKLFWEDLLKWVQKWSGWGELVVRLLTLGTLILLLLLLVYGTDLALWIGNRLLPIFQPLEPGSNVEDLNDTFHGLIVFGGKQENSPAERAIRHHWNKGGGNLKHCWIICTDDSLAPVQDLIETVFANEGVQQKVSFHYGEYDELRDERGNALTLLVPSDKIDDPNYIQLLVDAVYRDVEAKDLSEKQVIADYTGGTKSMTAGMVLACASPERELQYFSQQVTSSNPLKKVSISFRLKPARK
jgi:hypothetical protein